MSIKSSKDESYLTPEELKEHRREINEAVLVHRTRNDTSGDVMQGMHEKVLNGMCAPLVELMDELTQQA